MSYCLTASCLAHKREVFWQPPWQEWVHTNCAPCEALAGQPDPTLLACRYCGASLEIDGGGKLWSHVPDAPGHWDTATWPHAWHDDKWTRECPLSPTYQHESARPWS